MLSPGVRLGRYEIVAPLGAGGMGEVYRARDTELDRRVALKVLPDDVASDPDRLKRFEREAKATAALSHPNVLTVFDVGREDGRAYLVFELLEGSTLGVRLARGPLSAPEALGYAVQIARGLSAAHARGIVHRDLKPDNLFLTTAGVVKVLDFGLARVQPSGERNETASDVTGPGTVMGTVSYMAPEQAKGHRGDARSDIFSLGTVLYEMLSGKHPFRRDSSAETLTAILRDEPQDLGTLAHEVPAAVERLVGRCLEKRPEDRFQTANDLALALEAVAGPEDHQDRASAVEPLEERPYPGLSSFTEGDAAQFFGREAEIAALWEKLRRRALLALIGPSGVGKTSFLRAGLIPQRPGGWAALYLTPGAGPVGSLARAMTAPLASDPEAMANLVQGATTLDPVAGDARLLFAVSRWRQKTSEALLVVDQFEELFTLNPRETQDRFAGLLGRMAVEADVHVLLSMRDDFLFRCTEQPALSAVFDSLTPLTPPSSAALRRALVEPAARLGVRFEDEPLVAEMVAAVEKERGALPLLAFAVSRLWDERDRERQILTRAAYERIGGVAGALAQHAEATLQAVGPAQETIVREIFRNLVTAEGTRAARQREELLSVFAEKGAQAGAVLDALVSARLLTEYEEGEITRGVDINGRATPAPRIEIVHESLLTHWPRLERWLAQDAEGVMLRDQLRQAAHLWDEKGRPDDLLWTQRTYLEYTLWRGRYQGGLSAIEEAFAKAMTALAGRRRQRRRAVTVAVFAAVLALAAGATVLWLRAERAREAAQAEAGRREAAQILALGRLRLEDDPSAAFAHALASLEKADSEAARRFAVEALWQGPIGRWLPSRVYGVVWSPDGRWLATNGTDVSLFDAATGGRRQLAAVSEGVDWFSSDGETLTTYVRDADGVTERVRSTSTGDLVRSTRIPAQTHTRRLSDREVLALTFDAPWQAAPSAELRAHGDGEPRLLGRWALDRLSGFDLDVSGRWLASAQGGRILVQRLDRLEAPPRELGRLAHPVSCCGGAWSDRIVTGETSGELRVWSVAKGGVEQTFRNPAGTTWTQLDPGGRLLAAAPYGPLPVRGLLLFDLDAPPDAEPIALDSRRLDWLNFLALDPTSRWLASAHSEGGAFLWPVATQRPVVLRGQKPPYIGVAFTPDGKHLASTGEDDVVRLWPLTAGGGGVRTLWRADGTVGGDFVKIPPQGGSVVVSPRSSRRIVVIPLEGGSVRIHDAGADHATLAADSTGRWVAVGKVGGVHLVDLTSGRVRRLPPADERRDCWDPSGGGVGAAPFFLPDGRLISSGFGDLRLWNLEDGSNRVLRPCEKGLLPAPVAATPDSRQVLLQFFTADRATPTWPTVVDVDTGATRRITSHGSRFPDTSSMTLDPTGRVLVTGDQDGLVRVGPLSGEEPHLLFGHTRQVTSVAVSRDGNWIASGSDDGTIRLWPMPDVTKPPLHTLPYDELLKKLRAVTNLRVVPDAASASGYKIEAGPFPGWKEVPTW